MNFYLQPAEDENGSQPRGPYLDIEGVGQPKNNDNDDPGYVLSISAATTVPGHSSSPNSKFTRYIWPISFLYTLLGPLSDLIENLFTLFSFAGRFKNYQVLISFCAFDLADLLLVGLVTLFFGSGPGLLLNTFFEIAQCVVYLNFCEYSRISLILLIIITIFQIAGKASKVISALDSSNESDGIVLTTLVAGSSYLLVMDICGWIFTLGSNTGVYSDVSFLALITAHLWAVKYFVCVGSDWNAQKEKQREYKHRPPPLTSLLSNFNPYTNRVVIALLLTYTAAFLLVAFAFGITNLKDKQNSFADRSLCIYGIVCGAVLLCSLCAIPLMKWRADASEG